jgi:hypothetical protein
VPRTDSTHLARRPLHLLLPALPESLEGSQAFR